jgi:hypothetical protein
MFAVGQRSPQQAQVHQLIATLRKALTLQKQLEESCERTHLPIEYRWSVSAADEAESVLAPDSPIH